MLQIDLSGNAYSPINPSWTYGPVAVSFDLSGGNYNAVVSDFSLSFNGQHITFPTATANDYFTPTRSGIAVFASGEGNLSNFTFVWNSDGTGGFKDSSEMVYMNFAAPHISDPIAASEPATLALFLIALLIYASSSKHRTA